MRACKNKNSELALQILASGKYSLEKRESNDIFNAFNWAIYNDMTEVANVMLELDGIDINDNRNHDRKTPLILACANGNKELAFKLIERGAYINVCDKHGKTPFLYACGPEAIDIALKLIENGMDIHVQGMMFIPLIEACNHNNIQLAIKLLELGVNINAVSNARSHYKCLGTALEEALEGNYYELAFKLLEYGADVDLAGSLYYACFCSNYELAAKMIDLSKNLHSHSGGDDNTLLNTACSHGKSKIAIKLIECGIDVNIPDVHGVLPLEWACTYKQKNVITKLIMYGATFDSSEYKLDDTSDSDIDSTSGTTVSIVYEVNYETIAKYIPFIDSIHWTFENHKEWSPTIREIVRTILMILYRQLPPELIDLIVTKSIK